MPGLSNTTHKVWQVRKTMPHRRRILSGLLSHRKRGFAYFSMISSNSRPQSQRVTAHLIPPLCLGPMSAAGQSTGLKNLDDGPQFSSKIGSLLLATGVVSMFAWSGLRTESDCEAASGNSDPETVKLKGDEQDKPKSGAKKKEKKKEEKKKEVIKANYAAVMLDEPSVKLLKDTFPALFPQNQFYHHMTVKHSPSAQDIEDNDDLLSNEVSISVLGIAEDKHCQTLLVKSETMHVVSDNRFPHITLSTEGGDKYHAVYSNKLLERIAGAIQSENPAMSEDYDLFGTDWNGTLPETDGFEETVASFRDLRSANIKLEGCFCLDTTWDDKKFACSYERENQCGFCLFMKGGPCRNEFMEWEKCVGIAKENEGEEDFVDRCAPQTLLLKTCVDNNPEYYYIVSEDGDSKEKSEAKQGKSSEEPKQDK